MHALPISSLISGQLESGIGRVRSLLCFDVQWSHTINLIVPHVILHFQAVGSSFNCEKKDVGINQRCLIKLNSTNVLMFAGHLLFRDGWHKKHMKYTDWRQNSYYSYNSKFYKWKNWLSRLCNILIDQNNYLHSMQELCISFILLKETRKAIVL